MRTTYFSVWASNIRKRRAAAAIVLLHCTHDEEEKLPERGVTRKWIRRKDKGLVNNIVEELCLEDTAAYKEMLRMSHESFFDILGMIDKDIIPIKYLVAILSFFPKQGCS